VPLLLTVPMQHHPAVQVVLDMFQQPPTQLLYGL
jgi:hypothetical protein